MNCPVVPSSTLDQVENVIDIDDREEDKLNYNNNNNIILDGSSRANELLNGLTRVDQRDKDDGVSLECIPSRKPSVLVHPDTDDDSTSPTPLIMSAIETGIPAIEYSHSFTNSNHVRINPETASSSMSSSSASCSWFRRALGLTRSRDIDKRLASSYTSFHVGRFLAIAGSLTLLGGLFLKFLMLHDEKFWSVITWFAASTGLVFIFIGAGLVLWAALVKAQKARQEFEEKLHSGKVLPTNKLRPSSALSSSSFHSNNSRVPILGNHLSPSFHQSSGLQQEQSQSGHANKIEFGNDTSENTLCVNLPPPNHDTGFTPSNGDNLTTTSFSAWQKY